MEANITTFLDLERGARNLLQQCARAVPGERLLLVGERCDRPFFDPTLCSIIERVAASLGISSETVLAPPASDAASISPAVINAMKQVDVTIFFSRLGDQLRFSDVGGANRRVMTYTLTREHLGSKFATTNYSEMRKLQEALLNAIQNTSSYRIESENGTNLTARIPSVKTTDTAVFTDFALDLFPVMIFPPITFFDLEGCLVLEHFLLSSSTHSYDSSVFILDTPVTVRVKNSRMISFEGDHALIDKLENQLERAASITGGDPFCLNSWHTGINPFTFYDGDPYADLERWGTVAYGSPRYTHIHAAGNNPGDISIQLFDATISFDGKLYWKDGRFLFFDQPELHAITDRSQSPDSWTNLSIGF